MATFVDKKIFFSSDWLCFNLTIDVASIKRLIMLSFLSIILEKTSNLEKHFKNEIKCANLYNGYLIKIKRLREHTYEHKN